ncbi:hypothetical protein HYH02_015208 [Chlamydomonas schloesseri]|uniref:Protein kinase domain-containing protein n=2 Tax=Chlamydomonas schloesseri TaxID=2026947 RepID=A0A835SBG5_9CHLO|nr:hypothetical protein HYH02_015208 [Chlamydomonas schloesseri]|eukprot:KAG2424223.1 hypothetical protein HYH02_015208 [Chlamydomonas schloesseri]
MAPKQKGDAKVSTAASFDVPLPPAADLDKSLIDGDNAEIIVTVLAIVASDGARLHEVIKRYAPKHSFEGGQGKIWKVQLQPRLDPASQLVLPVIDMRAGPDKKMAKEGLSEEQLKTKLLGTPVPGMLKLIWTRYEQTGQILDLARNIIVQAVLSTGALGFLVQRLIRVSVTPVLKKHVAAQLRLQGGVAAGGGKGTDKVQAAADSIEGLLATQLAPQQDGSMADGLRSIAREYLRQVKLESHADMLARAVTYKTLPPVHENLVEDWMRIGTVLLMILDAMDQANVVHRDLKPANFLMSIMDGGTWMATRLADLGLARMVVDSQLNLTPGLLGTPGWMHILRCLWKAVFGEDPIRISDKEMDRQCGGKVLLSMPLSGELLQRHPISLGVGAFRYMLSWFSTEYLLPCDDRVGYGNAPVQLLGIQFALDLYLVGGTSQELSEALLLLTLSQTVSEQPQGRAVFATRAASTGEYLQRSEALFEECRPAWEAHAAKRRSMPTDAILDGRVYNAKQRLSEATALVREILGLCAVPQEEMRDRRVQAAVEQLMQRQRSAATLTCVGSGDGLQLKVAWVNVEAELRCIRGTFGGAGGDGTAAASSSSSSSSTAAVNSGVDLTGTASGLNTATGGGRAGVGGAADTGLDTLAALSAVQLGLQLFMSMTEWHLLVVQRPNMVAPGRDAEEHEAHEEREEDEEDELWLRKVKQASTDWAQAAAQQRDVRNQKDLSSAMTVAAELVASAWCHQLAVDRGDALSPLHHILAGSDAAVAEAAARKAAGADAGSGGSGGLGSQVQRAGGISAAAAGGSTTAGGGVVAATVSAAGSAAGSAPAKGVIGVLPLHVPANIAFSRTIEAALALGPKSIQLDMLRLLFATDGRGNLLFAGPTKAMSLDIANSLPTAERAHVLVEMGFMSKQQAECVMNIRELPRHVNRGKEVRVAYTLQQTFAQTWPRVEQQRAREEKRMQKDMQQLDQDNKVQHRHDLNSRQKGWMTQQQCDAAAKKREEALEEKKRQLRERLTAFDTTQLQQLREVMDACMLTNVGQSLDKEAQKKLCFSLTCLMPALVSYANHALTQSMSIAAFLQQHPRALAVSLRGQQQAAAVRPAVAAGAGAAAAAAARPAGPAAAPPPLAPPPLAPAGRRGRGALAPVALVPRKAPGEIAAGGRPGGVVPLAMAPAPCQGAAPTAMPAAVRGLGGAAPTAMAAAPGAPLLSAGPDEAGMEEAGPEEAGAVDAGSEAEEAADAMAANVVMLVNRSAARTWAQYSAYQPRCSASAGSCASASAITSSRDASTSSSASGACSSGARAEQLVHAAIQTCDSEQALKLLIHKLAAFNTQDLREIEDPASPLVPTLLQAAQAAQVQQACGHAVMERAPPQPGQQGLAGLQGGPTSEPPMPQLAATMERKRQCPQEDVEMEEAVQPLQVLEEMLEDEQQPGEQPRKRQRLAH